MLDNRLRVFYIIIKILGTIQGKCLKGMVSGINYMYQGWCIIKNVLMTTPTHFKLYQSYVTKLARDRD